MMPIPVFGTRDNTYTCAEIDNKIGGASGNFSSLKTTVTVTAGASWTADTTTPALSKFGASGETWYYADLTHNLNAAAHPVAAYDIDRFNVAWLTHQMRSANVVRVWLSYNPTGSIDFKVLA